MLFQLADVICFDIARQQVNRTRNVAFTEIVTLTQIDNHGIFFVDQARRFTAGDDFNFRHQPFKGGEQHRHQQRDPRDAQDGVTADELHNFLHGGLQLPTK